ncbi:MAG: HDOD domain-containing protein, partial [Bdellovibrionales bacterium]|nr:HDOD domain-containing protein [Bdellovibrionales bacterium]
MTQNNTPPAQNSTATDFIEKLRKALSSDGDFPASARVVSELREIISKPESTPNQVAEIILREPSLGTRILSMVNSSFYRRAKPIMTVSQAVVQIGMRPLAELCSGLILLQKFIPAARSGGPFAKCLKKSITTSLLTSSICQQIKSAVKESTSASSVGIAKDESGYLTGMFAEIGTLLLAYYFPKLYESAEKRSLSKKQPISKSIAELVGLTPTDISRAVLSELKLPDIYREILSKSMQIEESPPSKAPLSADPNDILTLGLYCGTTLSTAINEDGSKEGLEAALSKIGNRLPSEDILLSEVLGSLVDTYRDHCASLELNLPELPQELRQIKEALLADSGQAQPETHSLS